MGIEERIGVLHPTKLQVLQLSLVSTTLHFAKSLVVVNDLAERAVGMMQQFVKRYNKEKIQNRLLTVGKDLL